MFPPTRIRTGCLHRRLSSASLLLLAAVSSAAIGQTSDRGTWQIHYGRSGEHERSRERVQLTFAHTRTDPAATERLPSVCVQQNCADFLWLSSRPTAVRSDFS